MISSTTPPDRLARPELLALDNHARQRAMPSRAGQISTENAEFLRLELQRQPEIRPEVVARARALIKDPSYPPMDLLRSIAGQILASPDFSEELS
jgi:hypothetical protein